MDIFLPEHTEILKSFNRHHVRYILVGGYAVIYHGYRRTTGDLDIWLKPTNENKTKIISAFSDLGFDLISLQALAQKDFTQAILFYFGEEPQKTEFMTKISLVDFEEAYERKMMCELEENFAVPFLSIRDLILSKMNTGRLKDQADVEELQKIFKFKNET